MTRLEEIAGIAAKRIANGIDPVSAIASAIRAALAELSGKPRPRTMPDALEDEALRAVQWAVYLGCTTAGRLAAEWKCPPDTARDLLERARVRRLIRRCHINVYRASRPLEEDEAAARSA